MENKEVPESKKEIFVRLNEAERLKEGKNFFDQEPFRTAVQTVSQETNIDALKLNWFLRRFSNEHLSEAENEGSKWAVDFLRWHSNGFGHKTLQ